MRAEPLVFERSPDPLRDGARILVEGECDGAPDPSPEEEAFEAWINTLPVDRVVREYVRLLVCHCRPRLWWLQCGLLLGRTLPRSRWGLSCLPPSCRIRGRLRCRSSSP